MTITLTCPEWAWGRCEKTISPPHPWWRGKLYPQHRDRTGDLLCARQKVVAAHHSCCFNKLPFRWQLLGYGYCTITTCNVFECPLSLSILSFIYLIHRFLFTDWSKLHHVTLNYLTYHSFFKLLQVIVHQFPVIVPPFPGDSTFNPSTSTFFKRAHQSLYKIDSWRWGWEWWNSVQAYMISGQVGSQETWITV